MLQVQQKDDRGYFVLPQAPEDAGYYVYGTPGGGVGQFGHPALFCVLFWVEREWQATERRKFGVGNISKADGPPFVPHHSHRDGLQVDVRAIRRDGEHAGVCWQDAGYDREATAKLIGFFRSHPSVKKIYFNDLEIHGVFPLHGHDNHFHVEVRTGAL